MSKNQCHTIGKSPSESCQIGRAKIQTACDASQQSKYTSKGVFGSPDLTLPYDSNSVSLSSINESKKLLQATKKILEQEFKYQIAPHGSVTKHTLEILERRLSNNLKKLLPIWQKRGFSSRTDRNLHSKLKVSEVVSQSRDSTVYFPTLTASHKCSTAIPRKRQQNDQNYKKDSSSIVSIASRTRLTSRYEIKHSYRSLTEEQRNSECIEENGEKYQVHDILRPTIPCFRTNKEGDSVCCQRSDKNEANISKKLLSARRWNCRKASLYKDFSPLVLYSGRTASHSPAYQSTPVLFNIRTLGKGTDLKPSLSRHLSWRFGKARSTTSATDAALPGTSSGCFAGQYSGFFSKSEINRGIPGNLPKNSSDSYFDCAAAMGSTSRQAKPQQFTVSQPIRRPVAVTEHRSFANLPSSFNMPVANVGHMSISAKNAQLRNSKSFHGDARHGMSEPGFRMSNGTARRQSRASAPRSMSNGNSAFLRQQQTRKMLERQKMKILKPLNVSKNQNNMNNFGELGQEFSTPTLPDSGTASYRLTHDVSFDEGSRYEGSGAGALNSYKSGNEDTKNGSNRRRIAYASNDDQSNGRPDKLSDPYNRERAGPPAGFKETPTLSFMRSDDRQNPSFGFMTSPGSRGQSAQVTNSTPVPMQPVSASRSTAFRVSKESRQSWNHRMGDLSVNGGGLYGSSPIQPGGRVDTSGLASLSINPPTSYSQKISQSRDKNGVSPLKSRLSSRYGNRFEGPHSFTTSAGKESLYADPCIGAPCSFQQRLTELSLLESDTVKYEKSRKTKRKSKQDKDS